MSFQSTCHRVSTRCLLGTVLLSCAAAARGQISLTAAADMALRNNLRVKLAEDDVARARAALAEARDIYVPAVTGSSAGLGYGYGFPLGTPTLYSINASSLVYSAPQREYIRASREALVASNLVLKDVRETVLEDVTQTYLALSRLERQHAAMGEELAHARRLEIVVSDRLAAGIETRLELISVRRQRANLELQMLVMDDEIDTQNEHLARIVGLTGTKVETLPDGIPEQALDDAVARVEQAQNSYDSPAVLAAFATARSRMDQARGDTNFAFRPVISFGAQYSKFSTYNNAYTLYYPSVQGNYTRTDGQYIPPLTSEAAGFALNVTLPVFDRARRARAQGAVTDAVHARHLAELDRDNADEGRSKLRRSLRELGKRVELAQLDREYTQSQLDAILVQLKEPAVGGTPPTTPKEEQNARINERQHFVDYLNAQFQLESAEVNMLRQTGGLESWLKAAAAHP